MDKVEVLRVQCKIKGNQNGRKNLLVEEVITLGVAILVILGIIMVENRKRVLSLKVQ